METEVKTPKATKRDEFNKCEYSKTPDRFGYLKQLKRYFICDFNEIVEDGKIIFNEIEFEIFASKVGNINNLIYYVCRYGTLNMLKSIAGLGADLNKVMHNGQMPIHMVIERREMDMFNYLLECNVDVESMNGKGRRPLHCAIRYGTLEMFTRLVECGVYLTPTDIYGNQPMHYMRPEDKATILKYLNERGISLGCDL